jgi:regulatory protein NPR1
MDASAVVSLARLSTHLECLLNPAFLGRADAAVVLAEGGAVVGAYSCILAARSPVLHRHISSTPSGERPRLELAELVRGGHRVGREALHAVLGYMYTGVFKAPLQKCADGTCGHAACRPAIDFVVESTYAACGFQIPELVSLCQVNRGVALYLHHVS